MAEEEGFEPPRLLHPFGFQDRPLQPDLGIPPLWWLRAESNRRHMDFQSIALPTELPSHSILNCLKWRSRRDLNPRSPVWQTGMLTTTPRDHNGCGDRTWTYDLRVMSPTSYQLLYSAIFFHNWWTRQDSNLRPTGYEPVALTNWATGPEKW